MATIRRIINALLGRSEKHEAACQREEDAAKHLQSKAVTTIHAGIPRPAEMTPVDRWRRSGAIALLLCVGLMLSGCAVLEAIGPSLAKWGIEKAETLAKGGEKAIADAREKAEAIPDAIERSVALLEILRAEQIRQTYMLEYLVAAHPPDFIPRDEPKPDASTAGAR